jgi:serine/threonine protein kinase
MTSTCIHPTAGTQLGPYELLSRIGEGGMGEVWEARDMRLGRIVAIKRLKGPHSSRFEHEARAIASLNHPHICQIYDVGPDYLVLEYIEGKPLPAPLPPEEARRLAIQIASAVEEAHARGILHRDLKPRNILVTTKGQAKLLDFGLALRTEDSSAEATRTIEGTVMGTAGYMAPEQARGKPLDERSDVFSFGAVLYELLSGRRAFRGGSRAEVLSAVLRDDPAPFQAPAALQRVVWGCLRKDPSERFQTIGKVRASLEEAPAKRMEHPPSIAVLPFANLSHHAADESFSDGLADELTNALTQVAGLKVIARTSAFAFKGQNQDIRRIAHSLGASSVVEGSVRRCGSRLRVTAQLIRAADGTHIWAQRYERKIRDEFAVQDEICAAVVNRLKASLVAGDLLKEYPKYTFSTLAVHLPSVSSVACTEPTLPKLCHKSCGHAIESLDHAWAGGDLERDRSDPGMAVFSADEACQYGLMRTGS